VTVEHPVEDRSDERWFLSDQREFLLRSLEDAAREHQAGDLSDEDHAVLVDIIKNPAKNAAGLFMLYDVLIQRQLEPYEACILEARSLSLDEVPSAPKKKARR
jgi:hypothetical protein